MRKSIQRSASLGRQWCVSIAAESPDELAMIIIGSRLIAVARSFVDALTIFSDHFLSVNDARTSRASIGWRASLKLKA